LEAGGRESSGCELNQQFTLIPKKFRYLLDKTADIVSGGAWGRRPHTLSEAPLLVSKILNKCFEPFQAKRRAMFVVLRRLENHRQGQKPSILKH
jgi:hypothetical protein